jgi:hypothetical protein
MSGNVRVIKKYIQFFFGMSQGIFNLYWMSHMLQQHAAKLLK